MNKPKIPPRLSPDNVYLRRKIEEVRAEHEPQKKGGSSPFRSEERTRISALRGEVLEASTLCAQHTQNVMFYEQQLNIAIQTAYSALSSLEQLKSHLNAEDWTFFESVSNMLKYSHLFSQTGRRNREEMATIVFGIKALHSGRRRRASESECSVTSYSDYQSDGRWSRCTKNEEDSLPTQDDLGNFMPNLETPEPTAVLNDSNVLRSSSGDLMEPDAKNEADLPSVDVAMDDDVFSSPVETMWPEQTFVTDRNANTEVSRTFSVPRQEHMSTFIQLSQSADSFTFGCDFQGQEAVHSVPETMTVRCATKVIPICSTEDSVDRGFPHFDAVHTLCDSRHDSAATTLRVNRFLSGTVSRSFEDFNVSTALSVPCSEKVELATRSTRKRKAGPTAVVKLEETTSIFVPLTQQGVLHSLDVQGQPPKMPAMPLVRTTSGSDMELDSSQDLREPFIVKEEDEKSCSSGDLNLCPLPTMDIQKTEQETFGLDCGESGAGLRRGESDHNCHNSVSHLFSPDLSLMANLGMTLTEHPLDIDSGTMSSYTPTEATSLSLPHSQATPLMIDAGNDGPQMAVVKEEEGSNVPVRLATIRGEPQPFQPVSLSSPSPSSSHFGSTVRFALQPKKTIPPSNLLLSPESEKGDDNDAEVDWTASKSVIEGGGDGSIGIPVEPPLPRDGPLETQNPAPPSQPVDLPISQQNSQPANQPPFLQDLPYDSRPNFVPFMAGNGFHHPANFPPHFGDFPPPHPNNHPFQGFVPGFPPPPGFFPIHPPNFHPPGFPSTSFPTPPMIPGNANLGRGGRGRKRKHGRGNSYSGKCGRTN